ncbi:uncharacterized protein BX663DRAFT_517038 [Cokeromyces recurvatus]|uniref:uncharacterized protein n=1 Tax=Cokeromyces recurvatus TaxID=90255 RepID=UPI00221FE286|nr:uncharacterized protein BX663DRAFT_517038 [Cokeromyces recurvatus]KAI7900615.1 hypothetical protein BX663DRAFT_517038 [Cokeromyces recurvatus]
MESVPTMQHNTNDTKSNTFLFNKLSPTTNSSIRKFFNRFPNHSKPANHPPTDTMSTLSSDRESMMGCPALLMSSATTSSSSFDDEVLSPTQRQIDLVRTSWERVTERRYETDDRNVSATHAFGLAFYDALFSMDENCQSLFSNILQQARALTGMISYIARAPKVTNHHSSSSSSPSTTTTIRDINAINKDQSSGYVEGDPECLALRMRELGARHYYYNVKPEHFELVGPAFVAALKSRLADEYTDEIGEAWIKANAYAAYNMRIGFEFQLAWEEGTNQKLASKKNKAACTIQ